MKFDLRTWERWTEWIGAISGDVMRTFGDLVIFRGFYDLCEKEREEIVSRKAVLFPNFVTRCCGSHLALAVRRQCDAGDDAVSLAHLLGQVAKCCHQITYDFYLERFPCSRGPAGWQQDVFAQMSLDGQSVDRAQIDKDVAKLKEQGSGVSALVSRKLAHADKRGFPDQVSFGDLDTAMAVVDELTCKYQLFFTGSAPYTQRPTVVEPWMRFFEIPLIRV